jgi:hypothetical protein
LVFKTNPDALAVDAGSKIARMDGPVLDDDDDDDDSAEALARLTADAAAYATAKTPKLDPYPWWTWVDRNLEYRHNYMVKVLGAVIASERRDMRATVKREGDAIKGEFEQQWRELTVSLREQMLECGRTLREEAKAAREQLEQADAATRRELELSKRELVLLQREIGVERAVRALHDEVEVAKSEIPRLPEIEARVDAKQSKLAAEQKRLGEELAKQKDRLGKLRVDQSVTEYGLKEDLKELKRAQQPAVELKFESVDGVFTMKDLHPDAAAAWRRFVRELVEANEGTMFPNDPTGRVVALPRKNSNVA